MLVGKITLQALFWYYIYQNKVVLYFATPRRPCTVRVLYQNLLRRNSSFWWFWRERWTTLWSSNHWKGWWRSWKSPAYISTSILVLASISKLNICTKGAQIYFKEFMAFSRVKREKHALLNRNEIGQFLKRVITTERWKIHAYEIVCKKWLAKPWLEPKKVMLYMWWD